PNDLREGTFNEVRSIVMDKKRRTNPKDFFVIIKPSRDATYNNTTNILDEMKIDDVKAFALVDISPDEYHLIASR
ncbi:MAG TPA: biopolymer transporter ExbD, partial [Puia sp.]|nr:biopolymer transporter ExbD [Puia sp.]